MRGSWRIGRIMGIDIAVDASWFIIVFLLIYTLGFVQFAHDLHPRSFSPRAAENPENALELSLAADAYWARMSSRGAATP